MAPRTSSPWKGMKIRIHPLFWLVILLSLWTGHWIEILTLFVVIVIHELGHITAAWSFGWRIRSMEILPFGGVAKMDEWGTVPNREEIVVALAGPFHHVWMVLISVLFYQAGWWTKEWTLYFIEGNLWIATFNLLPIYPLDGGRVLQVWLTYLLPYRNAVSVTLWWSLLAASLLVILSFFIPGSLVHVPLFSISVFLLYSNVISYRQREYQFIRFLLHRLEKGIDPKWRSVQIRHAGGATLRQIVKSWYKEKEHIVEVMGEDGGVLGVLTEEQLLKRYFSSPVVPKKPPHQRIS
ncbi:M50 family metallopeptidase [Thermoactinomyces sp. DSM 45891]|uniref:M50 family metallopeptidase n=1 Tax=Thermoactinomyces sp. DSM 45891 TaxID=1761907 RepID=UPI0009F5A300|nr:M50 family metallopeptidase [Thermoactinomyces sp. DSM 45891]